jgi:class 3 adenylate cyclase
MNCLCSTKPAREHPGEIPELLARHSAILNQAIETNHGFVFRIVGDSFSAALEAQRILQNESWLPAPIHFPK